MSVTRAYNEKSVFKNFWVLAYTDDAFRLAVRKWAIEMFEPIPTELVNTKNRALWSPIDKSDQLYQPVIVSNLYSPCAVCHELVARDDDRMVCPECNTVETGPGIAIEVYEGLAACQVDTGDFTEPADDIEELAAKGVDWIAKSTRPVFDEASFPWSGGFFLANDDLHVSVLTAAGLRCAMYKPGPDAEAIMVIGNDGSSEAEMFEAFARLYAIVQGELGEGVPSVNDKGEICHNTKVTY